MHSDGRAVHDGIQNEGRPSNDQTMAEIAAFYNGLPDVRPVKKFESRGVAVTRLWAALSHERAGKPKVAKAAGKSAMSGRKQPSLERPRTRFINPVIPRHRVFLSSHQDGH